MTHYGLSAEADKAIDEGNSSARGYRPTVLVTKSFSFVIVYRPLAYWEGSKQSSGFTEWMRERLPALHFDAKRDFWSAPIRELGAVLAAMATRQVGCNYSAGLNEYLDRLEKEKEV